jgi:hypothetical protein
MARTVTTATRTIAEQTCAEGRFAAAIPHLIARRDEITTNRLEVTTHQSNRTTARADRTAHRSR